MISGGSWAIALTDYMIAVVNVQDSGVFFTDRRSLTLLGMTSLCVFWGMSKKLIKFLVYLQIKSSFQGFAIFIALKGQFNSAQGNALGK
jgi:hypothetical protein